MPTEAFASSLTVWIGSNRYTFPPGRDVTVGRDSQADIRIDGVGVSTSSTSSIHMVLHHDGRQWVAVDRSESGIYVDGVRMSTVFIHDGRAITLGDPQHGPQLIFRLAAPAPPPPRDAPWLGMRPAVPPSTATYRQPAPQAWPPHAQPSPRSNQPNRPPVPPPPAMPTPPASPPSTAPSQASTQQFRLPPPQPEPAQPPPWATLPSPAQPKSTAPKPPSQLPTRQFGSAQPQPGAAEGLARPPQPTLPPAHPVPPPGPPRQAAHPWAPPIPPQPGPPQPHAWAPSTLPPPQAHPQPAVAWHPIAQHKRRLLVERLAGAMRKLFSRRRKPRLPDARSTEQQLPEAPSTDPLRRQNTAATDATSSRPAAKVGPLKADQLGFTFSGQQLLGEMSFTAEPGTLTAIVGPSEASTSALINVLSGGAQPSVGTVTLDGHNVHAEDLHCRIGIVPQYDLGHPQLTVDQALCYAAELRLPPGAPADHRRRVVNWALNGLQLTSLRTVQAGNLSAEQRKRVSMAIELLTGPALLLLDQPTAGLDPALQQQTMALLRRLADDGRVVVVATTSPTDLDMCDQVLLLTSTGTPAFAGSPADIGIGDEPGTTSWSEILTRLSTDPDSAHTAFLARQQDAPPPTAEPQEVHVEPLTPAAQLSVGRQIAIAARRQAWLIAGDQRYLIFLIFLPLLFGAIALLVPGHAGLGPADPYGDSPDEAVELLAVLNIGAVVMGTALGIRGLRGEQRIFRREQANGLSASAFLAAKIIVYSFIAIIQTGIITIIAVAGKGAPTQGAVLLGNAVVELFLTLAITAIVSAIVALAVSSLTTHIEQILLAAVLITLISLMFSGGMFPLADRLGLEQISWFVPSRWGFAASASTVDVPAVDLLAASDTSWTHSTGRWLFDMAMLAVFGAVATVFLRFRLRMPARQRGDR
jgi:ABC transport system ATP-binding/permease protein